MVYWDDQAPPISHYALPYDPWDDWSVTPAAPASDELRQAIKAAMDLKPGHGPSRIKADLWHGARLDVSIAVIFGVKAGL
jgi:hypothetical protein